MANEKEKNNDDEAAVDPVVALTKKLKFNRMVLIVVAVISAMTIATMATGVVVMNKRLAEVSAPPPEAIDEKFAELEEQIEQLSSFRRIELRRIDVYSQQLAALRQECSVERAAPLTSILEEREADFQKFIKIIQSGTESFAGMIRGSRKWVDQHNAVLEDLAKASKERQQKLKAG